MAVSWGSDYSELVWSGFEIEKNLLHRFISLQCNGVSSIPIFYYTTFGGKHLFI